MKPLIEQSGSTLRYNFHTGQWRAWESKKRFPIVLAGTQGGKTSFGPPWFHREIKQCGPGDYMIVAPNYPLLEPKALPEFLHLFQTILGLGEFRQSPTKRFVISERGERALWGCKQSTPTRVLFGYGSKPESLESSTLKAAWVDEGGQKDMKVASYEALRRRLSLNQGRMLVTTTIYDLGCIKRLFYDRWRAGDPEVDIISFPSIANPAFPREEYYAAEQRMQRWKFDMFYRAIFTRPAGLIYGSFDETLDVRARMPIPTTWERYLGLDFGGVNTAGVFYAVEPLTRKKWLYRIYHAGNKTAADHVKDFLEGEPGVPYCVGGSKSEGQWRQEFAAAGLPVNEPSVSEVEVGINRVYGAHTRREIVVFDDLEAYLDEKNTYSRKVDANGEPQEEIENKNAFHLMDAERYIISTICEDVKVGVSVDLYEHLYGG